MLEKREYTDGATVITAENMNDIQDSIIELESAVEQLKSNLLYATVE